VSIVPTNQGSGTSTRIRLLSNGSIIATYKVVVFGDVNGDGNVDDGDSGMIFDYQNYLYNWDSRAEKRFAADVNDDGNIDAIDSGIVTDCLNYIRTIDQTTGISAPVY
jgi:hypothetical protein